MDSNHDKGLQRALCYHYTIGQTGTKIAFLGRGRKENLRHTGAGNGKAGLRLGL